MGRRIKYYILLSLSLVSCTKIIHFDYKNVPPVPVIEGSLTQNGATVRISQTSNMNAAVDETLLEAEFVVITGTDGMLSVLYRDEDGVYVSDLAGTPGETYTLLVKLDGQEYSSTSTMPAAMEVTDHGFFSNEMMGLGYYSYDVIARPPMDPDPADGYFYRMLKDGRVFSWGVTDNRFIYPDGTIHISIPCAVDEDSLGVDTSDFGEDAEDLIVNPGDEVYVEAYAIDAKTLAFQRSVQMTSQSRANPVKDFTGGAMGYFAARYLLYSETIVFDPSTAKEHEYGF